jgi:flagellar biosynthesis/type III secretory pathway M-ring protein FliF/YscJ
MSPQLQQALTIGVYVFVGLVALWLVLFAVTIALSVKRAKEISKAKDAKLEELLAEWEGRDPSHRERVEKLKADAKARREDLLRDWRN